DDCAVGQHVIVVVAPLAARTARARSFNMSWSAIALLAVGTPSIVISNRMPITRNRAYRLAGKSLRFRRGGPSVPLVAGLSGWYLYAFAMTYLRRPPSTAQ